MSQIRCSLLNRAEVKRVNDFFNRIHGRDRTLAKFEWEFFNAPAGSAIYVLAEDVSNPKEPKVVGCQCAIPISLIDSKGQRILTVKSEDTLVDPEYRGQRIFNQMYDALLEECERQRVMYIWGLTSALKPFGKIGFECSNQYQRGIYLIKLWATYRSFASGRPVRGKLKAFAMVLILWLQKLLTVRLNTLKLKNGFNIVRDSEFDRNGLFLNAQHDGYNVTLDMSDSYMKWRLDENPYPDTYGSLQLLDGNKQVVGDVIYSHCGSQGYIELFRFKKDLDAKLRHALLTKTLNVLKSEGVGYVRFMGFDTNSVHLSEKEDLKKLGFWFMPAEPRINSFIWRPIVSGENEVRLRSILLSKLYTEGN